MKSIWTRLLVVVATLVVCVGISRAAGAATKIACVGDSITAQVPGWCGDLGVLLGTGYTMQNDGVSGATLLSNGDNPYTKPTNTKFSDSKNFAPDIVIIMLGTNDSKPQNWAKKANFESDYKALIAVYQALPSHPRVFLNLCPPAGVNGFAIDGTVIENEVIPIIRKVAADTGVGLIDVFSAMGGHNLNASYFSATDQVHPNAAGAQKIADTVYAALVAALSDAGTPDAAPVDARADAPSEAGKDAQADGDAAQGSGGAAGAAGSTAAGGSSGAAGAVAAGGASGAGGSIGGTGGAAGATSAGGAAGTVSVGGAAGTAGATNAATPAAEDSGGCSCSFASRPGGQWAALLVSLVALARRSRSRRRARAV